MAKDPPEPTPSPLELMRDMDAHLAATGIDPAAYPWSYGLTPSPHSYPPRTPRALAGWERRPA